MPTLTKNSIMRIWPKRKEAYPTIVIIENKLQESVNVEKAEDPDALKHVFRFVISEVAHKKE